MPRITLLLLVARAHRLSQGDHLRGHWHGGVVVDRTCGDVDVDGADHRRRHVVERRRDDGGAS
jgi:hypothetical protein